MTTLINITLTPILGVNFYRDAKKVRKLEILKSGRAKRDKDGNIVSQLLQNRLPSGTMARVEPNRRWFGKSDFNVLTRISCRKYSGRWPKRIGPF